jgi:putative oxidoreductase
MIGNTMGNGTTRMDAGLAALRVIVGAVFMAHGAQKLFIWGIDGVAGGFASMGIPLAAIAGPAVGVTEFVGGLALVVGLFTRVASAGLAAVMLGALLMVHLPAGFFLPDGGEFVLVLLAASASLALMGPGGFSVDGVLRRRAGA